MPRSARVGGRPRRVRTAGCVVTSIVLLGGTVQGCGDGGPAPANSDLPAPRSTSSAQGDQHGLGFTPDLLVVPTPGDALATQVGALDVSTSISRLAGGEVLVEGSGDDRVWRFPVYREAPGRYPRAAIRVVPEPRSLVPGRAEFAFGADVALDPSSGGRAADNGDNVVQRGLSSDPSFFKLEVDERRPACTVRGDGGEIVLRAKDPLYVDVMYRLECRRDGDRVTLRVSEILPDRLVLREQSRARGQMGSVEPPEATSVAIGGKLSRAGELIRSASDQFNGTLANVWVDVGD